MVTTKMGSQKKKRSSLSSDARVVPSRAVYDSPNGDMCTKARFLAWLMHISQLSSLHGFVWYSRTHNLFLRTLIALLSMVILVGLPLVVVTESLKYQRDDTILDAVEWKVATNITYPNITVCDAKFFERTLLEAYNISDDLATFMTLVIDPTVTDYVDFMAEHYGAEFTDRVWDLNRQLEEVMRKHNFSSLLQLFYAVATRCDNFLSFCEAHRRFYIAPDSFLDSQASGRFPFCCESFFDPKPIFSIAGTCYTTHARIVETFPSVYSSIRVWMYIDDENAPKYDMRLLGSDAGERKGIRWTVSHDDHPGRVLMRFPKKVDRRRLSEHCLSRNVTFEEKYGMKNTRQNCHLTQAHRALPNCSIAVYLGIKQVDNLDPCTPRDVLNANEGYYAASPNGEEDFDVHACPHDCMREEFYTQTTTADIDAAALDAFIADTEFSQDRNGTNFERETGKHSAVLQFYFETFDYPVYTLYRETVIEFLSKIGGWMSLAIGGSAISVLELVAFLGFLGWAMVNKLARTMAKM